MNTTTIPLRSVLPSGTRLVAPGPHCYNRTRHGWIAATAPWGNEDPQDWVQRQSPQLVYSLRGGPRSHPQDVLLQVFDLGGRLSDYDRLLVGALTTNQTEAFAAWNWYFLCALPTMQSVISDLEPFLNASPGSRGSVPKPPRERSKRKASSPKRRTSSRVSAR